MDVADQCKQEVNEALNSVETYFPGMLVDFGLEMEKCRRLALLALHHPCTRPAAVRIWEGE